MKHRYRNKKGLDRIIRINLAQDDKGEYIPYCNYKHHRGISRNYGLCESRSCVHYQRLYIRCEHIPKPSEYTTQ